MPPSQSERQRRGTAGDKASVPASAQLGEVSGRVEMSVAPPKRPSTNRTTRGGQCSAALTRTSSQRETRAAPPVAQMQQRRRDRCNSIIAGGWPATPGLLLSGNEQSRLRVRVHLRRAHRLDTDGPPPDR